MIHKGRLFTFGCSFTRYRWPTWADILGREFEEFYNYGQSSGGNLFISCSVAEAVAKHKINTNDTVIIMWTSVTREDRYIDGWKGTGNIFNQQLYPKEFIEKYVTVRGCYMRDIPQIFLIKKLLDFIGCKYEFLSMLDIEKYDRPETNQQFEYADILKLYKSTLDIIKPSVYKIIFNEDWTSRPIPELTKRLDSHPTPIEHLEYLNKVLPNYSISQDTLNYVMECDKLALEKYKRNLYGFKDFYDDKEYTKYVDLKPIDRL